MMASNVGIIFFVICCATVVKSSQDISEYSLTNLPTEESSIVAETSGIDTTTLKDTYHDLGKGAKMGFYAAATHKTGFKDKALSIHGDVSSLQDSSISAFQKFDETSKRALKNLQEAFEHISDSEEGKAHELLDEVGRQANDLTKEAKNIELQAGAGRDKVSSLLEEIYNSRVTLQTVSTAWEDVSNNCVDLKKRVTDKAVVATPLFQKQAITLYAQWLSLSKASRYFLSEVKPIEAIEDAQNKMKKDEL
uniref:Uncharacterized protein n=1 Tax=Amphimedon queenslandica TaxID=400682 RepID=A0A1X7TN13_AMPQE